LSLPANPIDHQPSHLLKPAARLVPLDHDWEPNRGFKAPDEHDWEPNRGSAPNGTPRFPRCGTTASCARTQACRSLACCFMYRVVTQGESAAVVLVTKQALIYLSDLFAAGPDALGSIMAGRAEEGVGDPLLVSASVAPLAQDLLTAASSYESG